MYDIFLNDNPNQLGPVAVSGISSVGGGKKKVKIKREK